MPCFHRVSAVALLATAAALTAGEAWAAPPGDWSIGIERVFGIVHVKEQEEVAGVEVTTIDDTSVSLGSKVTGLIGYSPARLAFDYLAGSGLTFGGALGYEGIGNSDADWWLVAARIGYLAALGDGVGLWPRGGLTYTSLDGDGDVDSVTALAITLEVPLVIYALGHRVGFEVIPYADIGIGGGTDTVDRTLTEYGLQFGLSAFF